MEYARKKQPEPENRAVLLAIKKNTALRVPEPDLEAGKCHAWFDEGGFAS